MRIMVWLCIISMCVGALASNNPWSNKTPQELEALLRQLNHEPPYLV